MMCFYYWHQLKSMLLFWCFFLLLVTIIHFVHLLKHFHHMYRNIIGLGTSVMLTVITIINRRGKISCTHSISSSQFRKQTMGTSVIGGTLFIKNCDFALVRLVSFKSEISLKLNKGPDRFTNGSNW